MRRADTALIPGAGHMVHHDQPGALAGMILDFLETGGKG